MPFPYSRIYPLQKPVLQMQLSEVLNTVLWSVLSCAAQTDGTISYVSGEHIGVVWNTSKKVVQHTMAALHFADGLARRTNCQASIGIATGAGLHGNVGNNKNRYTTTAGMPMRAAGALASLAASLSTFCMVCEIHGTIPASMQNLTRVCFRLIDSWLDACERLRMRVYQIDTQALQEHIESDESVGLSIDCTDMPGIETTCEQFTRLVMSALADPAKAPKVAQDLVQLSGVDSGKDPVCMVCIPPRDLQRPLYY